MMCPDWEAQLNAYADGTLPAAERARVDAHLGQCAGCRVALTQVRAVVAGAQTLPPSIAPPHDLWAGIARRIRQRDARGRRLWWRERTFWAGALAAAATFAIALGLYRLTLAPSAPAAGQGWVAIEADYEHAAADLASTLTAERARLRPETVTLVERNLRLIDAAIRESRAALTRDPGNAELGQLVAAAYSQKVELLRWATRVATAS
ncbi:MAG TPA: zf-HC2 domain-containing protein [Gemmatimonadales bacterium]|jgi:anti-sigma-K factor RskA|nr:zf-HC2 domain-containing protein [Gemmatimonadales bacterium]